jgi:hypothetical protein
VSRINFKLVATFLFSLLVCSSVFGQTSKGFIVGNITDPDGAVIVGANVKIVNVSTGVSRETVSTSDGSFRIDAVDPGTYRVEVGQTGFKTATRANVVVVVSQTTTVPFQLEVGIRSELVEVSSGADLVLQTQDGARVNTLSKREITDLPTPALNPTSIVFTLPGVVDPGPLAGGFVQGNEFSVNGLRARANNQLIDGLDNNDNSIAGQFYIPALRDGYSEVAVLQSDYSAEFGRAGGAVVNLVTRSGTNGFHGSVYDVINNSAFNSLTASQRADGTRKPVVVENTFGFSLGGPIKQDKLFFFGTYQRDLFRSGTDTTVRVPTASGFTTLRSLFPAGTNPNLDRYLNIVGDLRGQRQISSVALGNGRSNIDFGETTIGSAQPVTDDQFLSRVDWTPTEKDSLALRYVFDRQRFNNQFPAGSFPGFEVDVPSLVQNFYFNYTRNISTRLTNEARFGYGRFNVEFAPRDQQVGVAGPVFSFTGAGLGEGITSVGLPTGFPQGRLFNNYQFQDTISYTIGNHTLRFGADLNLQRSRQGIPFNSRGILTFAGSGGFNSFGNFVDQFSGRGAGGAAIQFGSPIIFPNAFYQNYFVNDTWRVKENLTLNLGLRYENYGTPFNAIRFPAFGGFDQPVETVVRQQRDNNNFAPRFSFAYQPRFFKGLFGENKTVFRGGFAVNYDFFFNNILSNTAATVPNSFGVTNLGASLPAPTNPRGIANFGVASLPTTGTPDPLASINTIPRNLVNSQTYVYNFSIQRELPFNLIGDVAYVGSRGTRLFINEQLNPGIGGAFNTLIRAFPNRGSVVARTNGGDSSYNSLQARLDRRFNSGLLLRFAYTFSKAVDDVNSEVFVTTGGSSVGSDPFNRTVDRSRASFDVPHRFVATFIYDVPSLVKSGFGHTLLGGYSIAGTYRLQSGNAESPFVGGIDLNGDGSAFNDRPAISNPSAAPNSVGFSNFIAENFISGVTSPTGFSDVNGNPINPSDVRFLVSESIRTGLAGRNILRGPRQNRLDLSLTKAINLGLTRLEADRFEIRFDFFNAFNTPQFAPGTGDVTDTTFNDFRFNSGNLNIGNVNAGRIGQFQLRYVF